MTVPIMLLTILVVVALAQVGVEGDATTNDFMGSGTLHNSGLALIATATALRSCPAAFPHHSSDPLRHQVLVLPLRVSHINVHPFSLASFRNADLLIRSLLLVLSPVLLPDTFWEYSQEKQAWEPVTAESMQYRLSKLDHELILASRLNATETSCTSSWPYRNAMGHADNASVTDYALSVLWSKSVFCVGDGGSVFERFWNEQIWVYVNHHSPLFEAASVTAYAGRMYVSARDGSVWERRRAGQELKWVNADVPAPHNVASPPRMDADGSLWFVSTAGHLLQCERKEGLATVCENWIDHRKPFGKCLAAVADASTFQRNTVFVVGVDGQLLQYDVRLQEWADLGRPVWASVGPAEAVALVNEQTGDRSMFLLSAEGTLIELFYRADPTTGANGGGATTAAHLGSTSTTSASSASSSSSPSSSDGSGNTGDSHNADAGSTVVVVTTEGEGEENQGKAGEATDEQRRRRLDGGGGGGDGDEDDHERHEKGDSALHWQWLDHGCPDGDRIVGPPGGLINMRSLFMVSANGTVYVLQVVCALLDCEHAASMRCNSYSLHESTTS